MIIVDTNVLSELMKGGPAPEVEVWFEDKPLASVFTTTITQAEILYGVDALPRGRRRKLLERAVNAMFEEDFADRILPFDSAAARAYAAVAAERRRAGRPISQFDAQIAGIARSRGAAIATRNVRDFAGCGIELHDPWVPNRR